MGSTDVNFNGEIFRKNHPIILSGRRDLASIKAVRLAFVSGGYLAGQVLGRNSVSGYYEKYDSGGASGLDTAAAVLFEDMEEAEFSDASDTEIARAIFGGEVFEDKLTDLDNDAKADLGARTIIAANGTNILKF